MDFSNILNENSAGIYSSLLKQEEFLKVKTDGRTLYWENLAKIQDYDGNIKDTTLDFCPDVLFENSVLEG